MRSARCVTEVQHDEGCVHYTVETETGETIWTRLVYFGKDRQHRAGGPAFQEAAREQERQARDYIGGTRQ